MRYLRTNTATRITVGPFLDKGDGITPEIALTVTSELLTFVVDTAGVPTLILDVAPTASGGANDMVHITSDAAGYYDLELAAADVNYLGRAMLSINDVATHLPVFHEFLILPAVIYDAMILGTDLFDVSVTQLLGTAWLTPGVAGTPDVNAKLVGALAVVSGAIPNAVAGAAGGVAIVGSSMVVPNTQKVDVETIKTQAVTCAAGVTVLPSVGAASAQTATLDTIKAETAGIETHVHTTIPALLPTALVSGRIDASVGAVANDAITAAAIANAAIDNATFAADVGSTVFATNIIALAAFKALDSAITDAVSLTAGGLLEKVRKLSWIIGNKITVTDANGNTVIYKDDSTTAAYTVNAMLTDDSTTTTRLRAA